MSNASTNSPQTSTQIATGLILLGASCRILSYLFSSNAGGDAGVHVALTAVWLQNPAPRFVFDVYPPGHFWLIGLSSLAVHDVVVAGRLLSLVLGILSLFFVWRLARLMYGMWAGLLSLAIFSLYSLHIAYSTTSSAEVSYLFFFLAGAYSFFCGLQGGSVQVRHLAVAGACLSIAESIRYEAWVLFGGLFVILAILMATREDFGQWRHWLSPLLV